MSRRNTTTSESCELYPTPAWCVRLILERLRGELPRGRWLEPAAGKGHIIRATNHIIPPDEWTAIEINRSYSTHLSAILPLRDIINADFFGDLIKSAYADIRFNVAITNPPFPLAVRFAKKCRELADWVIILQRLDFMVSRERQPWWTSDPPSLYVLPDRPGFMKRTANSAGSDISGYGWFVWHGPPMKKGTIEWLPLTDSENRSDKNGKESRRWFKQPWMPTLKESPLEGS